MSELLGQILLRQSVIDAPVLEAALEKSTHSGLRLGQILIDEYDCPEQRVYAALALQNGMQLRAGLEDTIDRNLLQEYPLDLFKSGRCLPLQSNENCLTIVVKDPLDFDIVLEVAFISGLAVETVLTPPSEMDRLIGKFFEKETFFHDSAGKISREFKKQTAADENALTLDEIRKNVESEPVVKMATLLFNEAIEQRASDIHIEPSEERAIIRFRVDGMLRQYSELTKYMYNPLTSRVKILAELDIAEKRIPQDGRIRYSFKGNTYDFRVSTLPTHHGEKTVIRILKHDLSLLELENLGMEQWQLEQMYEFIEKPQGMIIVTGPTGCGKSSTLFACLNRIRRKEINITTIENPIEYKLEGVNQVQINEKAGFTFATTLRSILRQDPDVILVGEIRDSETAQIAIQASQTGHLVFTTLHTNDSISAITRLKDLGIPGFMISSSLLTVLAQRLVRLLCPSCSVRKQISSELQARWKKSIGDIPFTEAFMPVGCPTCKNTGYLGRKGIFELMLVNDEARSMITEDISENQLKNYLRKNDMKTMIQTGIEKIKLGMTTPEEVLRVVLVDDSGFSVVKAAEGEEGV